MYIHGRKVLKINRGVIGGNEYEFVTELIIFTCNSFKLDGKSPDNKSSLSFLYIIEEILVLIE